MTKKRSVSHSALVKSLDRHPAMPALLKNLPPRAAAIMFQRIGIVDATDLMAMVPAQTLLRTLDESIWKSPTPGVREGNRCQGAHRVAGGLERPWRDFPARASRCDER